MISEDKPKLLLCGTGLRLGQMSAQTFQALKTCERVFCVNLPANTFAAMKEAFPSVEDVTESYRHGRDLADDALVARIAANWTGRTSLAVVFMGHPLLYSAATKLIGYCRSHTVSYRVLSGLSNADVALSVVEPYVKDRSFGLHGAALSILSAPDVLAGKRALSPDASAIVLGLAGARGDWKRFAAAASYGYAPEHPVNLVDCAIGGAGADRVVQSDMKGLPGLEGEVGAHSALFVPMKGRRIGSP